VPFTGQGFRKQSAEASAGAGDENHLLGIHGYPSFPVVAIPETTLMPEEKFGYKNEFSSLLKAFTSTNGTSTPDVPPRFLHHSTDESSDVRSCTP